MRLLNPGLTFADRRRGGDIALAVDGNFNHRHNIVAGDCAPLPEYHSLVFPPDRVQQAEIRLIAARGKPARRYTGQVPGIALDACNHAHISGDGSKEKTSSDRFDEKGIMAIICRHDIPLGLVSIDTPGEGQKFAVTLLQSTADELPSNATILLLYDVGDTLSRSLEMVSKIAAGLLHTQNDVPSKV